MKQLIDFVLHIDKNLAALIAQYGTQIYAILFLILFVETGLVIMPFLPGDSLLFTAGSFAGLGKLNIATLLFLCPLAAILGDNMNYFIGKNFSHLLLKLKIFGKQIVKQQDLDKTHSFFEKYGTKAIIMARFVPIIRTFTPFVAGTGKMNYKTFLMYDILGGFLWTWGLLLLGYFFGQLPIVQKHFEIAIFAIIGISILPMIFEYFRHKKSKNINLK